MLKEIRNNGICEEVEGCTCLHFANDVLVTYVYCMEVSAIWFRFVRGREGSGELHEIIDENEHH
jgi:hypothetical protein